MQTLVTGVSGYVGAALVARLQRDGHAGPRLRPLARAGGRARARSPTSSCSATSSTGAGPRRGARGRRGRLLPDPLDGGRGGRRVRRHGAPLGRDVRRSARRRPACGGSSTSAGWCRGDAPLSRHLGSRLAVEHALLEAVPGTIALRASIVIGARSRSFRFLVRLIERMPVMALPAWRDNRTAPIDGRDVLEYLARAATAPDALGGRSWDIGGPDVMTYAAMIARHRRRADAPPAEPADRPDADAGRLRRGRGDRRRGPRADRPADGVARARPAPARGAGRRRRRSACDLHAFDAAVERALRDWERTEELAGR